MIALEVNWWDVLQFVVSGLLPLLVGLVTTRATPGIRKGVLLAGLTVLLNLGGDLLAWYTAGSPGVFDLAAALFATLNGFMLAVAAQFGIYAAKDSSGSSLSDKLQAIPLTGPRHRARE